MWKTRTQVGRYTDAGPRASCNAWPAMSGRSDPQIRARAKTARVDGPTRGSGYAGRARRAQEASANAERRAEAARNRGEAAAGRIAELREDRVHPIQRPREAAERLAIATAAAAKAHRLALAEYEHAAVAHDEAARAHERVADWLEATDEPSRASAHRREAARARAAAREARRVAAAHCSSPPRSPPV